MYSDYKTNGIYKDPPCVSRNGWVTFASYLFSGRISDKEISEKSNFCSLIEQGDLAEKGFDVHDLIAFNGASLFTPSNRQFVKDQFTKEECLKL